MDNNEFLFLMNKLFKMAEIKMQAIIDDQPGVIIDRSSDVLYEKAFIEYKKAGSKNK